MAENWTIDGVKAALAAKKISARELAGIVLIVIGVALLVAI